jgi:hypothetical protein
MLSRRGEGGKELELERDRINEQWERPMSDTQLRIGIWLDLRHPADQTGSHGRMGSAW